jgi:lipopolysaccharide/colanic/teichoic acid biosynthesis glycosyltransferase
MELNEKIQARRTERKQEEAQRRNEESIEKKKAWVQSGGRKRMAKFTAKIILLPVYALIFAVLWLVVWSVKSVLF